ncbi:Protein CBG27548 [Caenorhabditis briggsae]|uniref:Protein CBG27548 n=1 Tax=Caenorhabditis briggsae TaxID=6238 RepID=B6IKL2_CAEBR|nr:Protein CBG27548 [Caenorhabditis briggsae]CAS00442.1 Protein CBG27548 [Caenorhabditis briggsae]
MGQMVKPTSSTKMHFEWLDQNQECKQEDQKQECKQEDQKQCKQDI